MKFAIFVVNSNTMRLFFSLSIALLSFCSAAQEANQIDNKGLSERTLNLDSIYTNPLKDSTANIVGLVEVKSEKIDLLIEDYLANKKYNGYRIQIFSSSNNRLEAVKAKSEFLREFPEVKSYLVYQAPNYKVRVGDFLDRLEANKELLLIQESFLNAFLVKGEIEPTIK